MPVGPTSGRRRGTLASGKIAHHTYSIKGAPERAVFTLESSSDLDLLVNRDGSQPYPGKADLTSRTAGGSEEVVVEELGDELGVGVFANQAGDYGLGVTLEGAGRDGDEDGNDGSGGDGDEGDRSPGDNKMSLSIQTNVERVRHGGTVQFVAVANDRRADSLTYRWDMDDGSVKSGRQVSHVYDDWGRHEVALAALDDRSVVATATQEIDVEYDFDGAQPPIARIAVAPRPATSGDEITLDATRSEAPDGTIVSYDWWVQDADQLRYDLGRGPEYSGSRRTTTVDGSTDLMIMLSVTDDNGSSDLVTEVLTVNGG